MKSSVSRTAMAVAMTLMIGAPALAQSQQDPHHPPGKPTAPQAAAPMGEGMMSAGHMPMMRMMMQMMPMMGSRMGGMSDMTMPGMHMADRIEGRLAFLKTELKITEAQAGAWNELAATLRTNARKLDDARKATAPDAASTPVALLERQERWYTLRLEGILAMKAPLERLYGGLSDTQKEAADELLGPHLGLVPMGMMSMAGMPAEMPMAMPMRGGRR